MSKHVEGPDFDRMAESRQIIKEAREDRAEIKRMREALERIIMLDPTLPIGDPPDQYFFIRQAQMIARKALESAH